jgi:hypothetical protein
MRIEPGRTQSTMRSFVHRLVEKKTREKRKYLGRFCTILLICACSKVPFIVLVEKPKCAGGVYGLSESYFSS